MLRARAAASAGHAPARWPKPAREWCWRPAIAAKLEAVGARNPQLDFGSNSISPRRIPSRPPSRKAGKVDILVNNAAITKDGLALRMKKDDWDAVLATNLTGAFLAIQQVLHGMMKERWGRIINISSVVGEAGNPGQSNYVASKAGLIGLTKSHRAGNGEPQHHRERRRARDSSKPT